jgi:hypothetical protein
VLVPTPTGPVRWLELPEGGTPGVLDVRFSADGRAVYVRTRGAFAVFDLPSGGDSGSTEEGAGSVSHSGEGVDVGAAAPATW